TITATRPAKASPVSRTASIVTGSIGGPAMNRMPIPMKSSPPSSDSQSVRCRRLRRSPSGSSGAHSWCTAHHSAVLTSDRRADRPRRLATVHLHVPEVGPDVQLEHRGPGARAHLGLEHGGHGEVGAAARGAADGDEADPDPGLDLRPRGRRDDDAEGADRDPQDRKSTRLNSSHVKISYA